VRRHVDDARRTPPPPLARVAAVGVVLDEAGFREDPEVVARRAARLAEVLGEAGGGGGAVPQELEQAQAQRVRHGPHLVAVRSPRGVVVGGQRRTQRYFANYFCFSSSQ